MLVVGGALVAAPFVDTMVGEWRQQQRATANDAAIPRYRNAVAAAYELVTADFEDAVVSYEVGARPTTSDGSVIDPWPVSLPTGPPLDQEPASGGRPDAAVRGDAVAPVVTTFGHSTATPTESIPPTGWPATVIRIPKIGLDQAVVEGVSRTDLKGGPGHYPGTPLPGHTGNMVISGHRTTYTRPFYDLDLLEPGDPIVIDTPFGSYRYLVQRTHVTSPDDVSLLAATDAPTLTLTTCTPKGSASQRLIVVSTLDGLPADSAP